MNLARALDLYRSLGHRQGQAQTLRLLGKLLTRTGDYPAARAKIRQALEIFGDLGDRPYQAWTLNDLGMVQQLTGDYPARRRPAAKDLCPATGRARLGYDRARILFTRHTGWDLHQLRHSAATHLGEQGIPLQLIMAKTRHRNPRTAMRYVRPGAEAVAEITVLLDPHASEAESIARFAAGDSFRFPIICYER